MRSWVRAAMGMTLLLVMGGTALARVKVSDEEFLKRRGIDE